MSETKIVKDKNKLVIQCALPVITIVDVWQTMHLGRMLCIFFFYLLLYLHIYTFHTYHISYTSHTSFPFTFRTFQHFTIIIIHVTLHILLPNLFSRLSNTSHVYYYIYTYKHIYIYTFHTFHILYTSHLIHFASF